MIRIDRSAVREPPELKALRDAGLKHAEKFFVYTPLRERRQSTYFNPYWQKAYAVPVAALFELFHGKCAFCESRVDPDMRGILDHFRPKWATRGLGSEYAPNHYWWLAFAWDNLYLSCPSCNKHRGPRFPVRGRRIDGPNEDPSSEEPLLLDPCSDHPDEHLRFDESGHVEPRSERGDITINLVALNRSDLVERRKRLVRELQSLLQEVSAKASSVPRGLVRHLGRFTEPGAEFSACATQILGRYLSKEPRAGLDSLLKKIGPRSEHVEAIDIVTPTTAGTTPRFIDEIRLRNFRGITQLTLRTPSGAHSNMDWLMLIGENAAGKSTILKAAALNLMSEADRKRLELSPQSFIRRGRTSARVEVRFRGGGERRVLEITPRGFRSSDPKAGATLMAYGATRLPRSKGIARRSVPVENLFNPFAPLADPVSYLLDLEKYRKAEFDYAARALKKLLPGKRKYRFRASRSDIIVEPEGSLRQLSDGFKSVIALAVDIMATVQHTYHGGMESADGIVLLDELGAHLHPGWRMRIAKLLRQTFPHFQFIVTTHDPLCLRGLRNGEVVTIEKTRRGRVFVGTDLPPIEGMRVEQILQSEYFGLRSSLDPELEDQFEQMYALKSKPPSSLTSKQRQELERLEVELARFEVLGNTHSERLMLSEINRFLASERKKPGGPKRDRAWAATQRRIASRLEKELGIEL